MTTSSTPATTPATDLPGLTGDDAARVAGAAFAATRTTPDASDREVVREGPSGPALRRTGEPEHLAMLEAWLRFYRPEELFDATGRLTGPAAGSAAPRRQLRQPRLLHRSARHVRDV